MDFEALVKAKLPGVVKGSDSFWHTDFLRTGIAGLDYALGGGFGYGRCAEIFGNWSSGKTMILYNALAANQKVGKSVLFESEGAFDKVFFAGLGGDPESLLVYPVDTVEAVFDGMVAICDMMEKEKSNIPIAIGWDGIAATGTDHLQETGMDKRDMTKALVMNWGSQLVATKAKKRRIAIISTNQVREQIGSNESATHTPGGKAWPFICSQRIELRFDGGDKASRIYEGDLEIGRWVRGEIVKNKLAAPFGKFTMPIFIRPGKDHPELKGAKTALGIDRDWALFYTYLRMQVLLPGGVPIVSMPSNGWYAIHESLAPGYKKFQKSDWLDALNAFPKLRTLPYDLLLPPAPSPV